MLPVASSSSAVVDFDQAEHEYGFVHIASTSATALHCPGAVTPALRWRVLAKTLQEEPADQVIGFAGFWQLAIRKECVP